MITIKEFTIVNDEKWDRAVNGVVGRGGELTGGIGEDASDEAKLAAYDKVGGLILKNGSKVKLGSFYDFKAKKPRDTAEIKLIFRNLEGEEVELEEGEDKPIEVVAAEKLQEKKNKSNAKNKKKQDDE